MFLSLFLDDVNFFNKTVSVPLKTFQYASHLLDFYNIKSETENVATVFKGYKTGSWYVY